MIVTFDDLAQYRGLVTMVDGAFDCLHPGHLAYLQAARSFGPPLLVNICPDTYTAQKHPILLPAHERAHLLNALACVQYVHVSDRPTVDVLEQLQPRYYVKGQDWQDRLPADQVAACARVGTAIAYAQTPRQSSTQLLKQFQPDLDAFEALVLNQQAADKPWEPTAAVPYDFESRKIAEGRHPELIRDVFQPEYVCDAGCGPGHLLVLLHELGVQGYGFDENGAHSRWEQPYVCQADLIAEDLVRWTPAERPDLVICREVLEHLTVLQICRAVTNLCKLSKRFVYLTTRFSEAKHFLDFATADALDPTHISIMPMPWLRHLFTLEGFKRRADLEARMDHMNKGRVLVYERA